MESIPKMNFRDFLLSLGINPPQTFAPGQWQRCSTVTHPRKKNASIKLVETGEVGFAQDFASMAEPCIWRQQNGAVVKPLDQAEIRSRIAAKKRELVECTKAAREFYAHKCTPLLHGHPYLDAKGLDMSGCHGLKQDARGDLVVPMRLNGSLISLQRITPSGTKLFWSGATTNGTSYVIERKQATITLVCEGLATGLTLWNAVPNARVIVAFNAGNLVRAVIHHDISGLCAVCADNDHETQQRIGKNPGVDGATLAADAIGCDIVIPECVSGTDFDDWRQELLASERQQNLFRKWKLTDNQMRSNALATIKACISARLKFIRTEHPVYDSLIAA